MTRGVPVRWRAGVRGSPIEHSLSPVLHRAAYLALGLFDWAYDQVRVSAPELAGHVAGLDETWRGLSLTSPLKEAAFDVVHTVSDLATRVGAINTLVRDAAGWSGHNTDVYGIVEALREVGVAKLRSAVLVGTGATARSAVAALTELGAWEVTFMVRDLGRGQTLRLAADLGLATTTVPMGDWPAQTDVVVGTVPGAAYHGILGSLPAARSGAAVLDCVYGDGPSPLLSAARRLGYAAVPGTDMLLHQAREQVRLMTGLPAPTTMMREALEAALDVDGSVPAGPRR